MNKAGAKRLLKLSKFLRSIPIKVFNMESWYSTPNNDYDDWGNMLGQDITLSPEELKYKLSGLIKSKKSCGTAACAMGYAVACFPEQLTIDRAKDHQFVPKLKGTSYTGFDAADQFFGLTEDESWDIFGIENYSVAANRITPTMVAKRIEKIVKFYHPGLANA